MTKENEDKFLNAAKRVFDQAEKDLDAATLARLRASRRKALEEGGRRPAFVRPGWLLPVGGMAAAGVVLAVAGLLWFSPPDNNLMQAGMSDIELLAAQENPDFFAELEFYEWLDRNDNAG